MSPLLSAVGGEKDPIGPLLRSLLGWQDTIGLSRKNTAVRGCGNLSHRSPRRLVFQNPTARLGVTSLQKRILTYLTILGVKTGLCSKPAGIRPLSSPGPGARPVLTGLLLLRPGVPLSPGAGRRTDSSPWSQDHRGGRVRACAPRRCRAEPWVPRSSRRLPPPPSVGFPVPVSIEPL